MRKRGGLFILEKGRFRRRATARRASLKVRRAVKSIVLALVEVSR